MRYAVLLLCSVLIGGTYAVAQAAPASSAAPSSHAASTSTNSAQALPAPPPLHPLTVAQAREILKLTGSAKLGKQSIVFALRNLRQRLPPYMPNDVVNDLKTSLENIDLDSLVIPIYQRHLSEKDAAAIIAFYKTPAGQRLLATMPEIVKESQEAGVEAGQKVAHEVIERHMAEIQAAAKKYKEEHSTSSSSSPQ